ncbi:MAG: hypothetical protein QOJ84_369 [Bradyrhizobium sp.]|nr:hypothetical protein [Bradyrhizobium sp.]
MTQDTYSTQGSNQTYRPAPKPEQSRDTKCEPLDAGPETPTLPDPEPCPEPCYCPPKSGSTTTCLDKLIDEQTGQIASAERAKSFKAELEDLLKKAKSAKQDYTKDKYKDLLDRWAKQDDAIADLIAKLVCAVPCWLCLIECEICKLLYAIRDLDLKLNGDGTLTDTVYSLRDLRYWQERNLYAKKEVFDRIKSVLAAWEKPAQTLDKILSDDAKLIDDIRKTLATDSASAVYDVFMKLVPMHLAIAPRDANGKIDTKIASGYSDLCGCDEGQPDACCGPDVGKRTVRQQLIGPQPYLVDPDEFLEIICCLAKERYLPAKDLLALAESDLAKTEADIKRALSDIDQKKASLAADFKASVVNPIDCDKYKPKGGNGSDPCNPCNPKPPATSPPR